MEEGKRTAEKEIKGFPHAGSPPFMPTMPGAGCSRAGATSWKLSPGLLLGGKEP